DAASAFARLGLPGPKDEAWRHTNVAPIARAGFRLPGDGGAAAPVVRRGYVPAAGVARLVFVDGRWDAKASSLPTLPPGVKAGSLGAALRESPELLEPTLGRL